MIKGRIEDGQIVITMSKSDAVRLLASVRPDTGIAGEIADALSEMVDKEDQRLFAAGPSFDGFESDGNGQGVRTRSAEEARDADKR